MLEADVAILEERMAFVEGRLVEQSRSMNDLRESIVSLERRMDHRFDGVDQRFVAIDQRFVAIDQRFTGLERRMDQQFTALDQRISTLDARMANQFLWVVGLQITTIVAVLTAVFVR